jgi:hypothetical protein
MLTLRRIRFTVLWLVTLIVTVCKFTMSVTNAGSNFDGYCPMLTQQRIRCNGEMVRNFDVTEEMLPLTHRRDTVGKIGSIV